MMNILQDKKIDKTFLYLTAIILSIFFVRLLDSNGGAWREIFRCFDFNDTGMDFFNSIISTKDAAPYSVFKTLYPPLANIFFYICYLCIPDTLTTLWNVDGSNFGSFRATNLDLRLWQSSLVMFLLYIQVTTLLSYFIFKEALYNKNQLLAISLLFTLGMLFALERGNIIVLSLIFTLFFLIRYEDSNLIIKELALLSLGIAVGIKIYPVIFSFFLLKSRNYKDFFRCVFYCFCCLIIPFFFFNGFSDIKIWFDIITNIETSVATRDDMYVGIDFLGFLQFVKFIIMSKYFTFDVISKNIILSFCRYFLLFFWIISFIGMFLESKRWKICLCLSLLIVFAQPHSAIYNSIYFIIPFIFFVNEEQIIRKNNILYFLFFVIILLPITSFEHLKTAYILRFTTIFAMVLFFVFEIGNNLFRYCRKGEVVNELKK